MGLEIVSIALGTASFHRCVSCVAPMPPTGFGSFASLLMGRNVVVWSDNSGAENAVKKGKVGLKRGVRDCMRFGRRHQSFRSLLTH